MRPLHYNIALAVANILFGASFSAYVSLLHSTLSVQQLFALQLVVSGAIFIPAAMTHRNFFRLTLEEFGTIFIVALLVIFGWWYMLLSGASYTNPIDASTLSTLGPILTLLTAIIVQQRRVGRGEAFGFIVAFIGVTVLLFNRGDALIGEGGEGYGNSLVICAVFAKSVNTVLISPVLRKHGTIVIMGWYYIVGILLALPIILTELPTIKWALFDTFERSELCYIVLLGTALPMYLLYVGSEHLSSTHTALYRYLQPIVATLLATIRKQSCIDQANIVGATLIFLGVESILATTRAKSSPRHAHRRR
jgi:drug/metabolite transporter (DMT)-like permease